MQSAASRWAGLSESISTAPEPDQAGRAAGSDADDNFAIGIPTGCGAGTPGSGIGCGAGTPGIATGWSGCVFMKS